MSSFEGKEFTNLGSRPVFNKTLRHIVSVSTIIDQVEAGKNLAEQLSMMYDSNVIAREQMAPILSVILVSRMGLPSRSENMVDSRSNFEPFINYFSKWNALDLVVAYHHPNIGLIPVNPANANHWAMVHELKKHELIVVYSRHKKGDKAVARKGLDAFFQILDNKTPVEDPAFIEEKPPEPAPKPAAAPAQTAPSAPQPAASAPAAAAPKPPAPAGKRNLTPKYSVQVSNELFHNGNVEAWKNIIESYEAKMKGCQVIVYHEGELIQDLNSLFKWGKVKHGGLIFFQVAGENIKGVSRLQKYLYEGASARYETFMKHDVNKILSLF